MLRKFVFTLLAVVMVVSVWAVLVRPVAAGQQKVTVCHKPGTPAEATLEIAAPAEAAHLAHGDTQGACTGPQSDGCTALNAVVADPPSSSGFYSFIVSDLDFFTGETIHVDMTVTTTSSAYMEAFVLDSSFPNSAPLGYDATGFASGQGTVSVDYVVVAGDDADGAGVSISNNTSNNGTFTIDSINFSCTPAS